MAAKTRKAPDCSHECSERKTKLATAPAAKSIAMAAEEAGALMLMENISEHSTQNTAAVGQTRRHSLSFWLTSPFSNSMARRQHFKSNNNNAGTERALLCFRWKPILLSGCIQNSSDAAEG